MIDPVQKTKDRLQEWLKDLTNQRKVIVEEYEGKLAQLDSDIADVESRIAEAKKYKKQ